MMWKHCYMKCSLMKYIDINGSNEDITEILPFNAEQPVEDG